MLMIPRYIARSNVTYPAPNKLMSIVVSLVENNQRKNRKKAARAMIGKRIFFMAICVSVLYAINLDKIVLISSNMHIKSVDCSYPA
jgi:hypothetical protein